MKFANDVFSLAKVPGFTVNLEGMELPKNNGLYFRAKQHELVEQYSAARIFMNETETDDWEHWFSSDQDSEEAFKLIFRSHFYETALFYYNAVVDISWTLSYVAAEFACTTKGIRVDLTGIKSIEESAEILRSAERNVTSPTAEENPFDYLRIMCPEFIPVFDYIISFWDLFSKNDVRKRYNYCKHKGRPAYEEIEELKPGKFFSVHVKDSKTGDITSMATDISDVRYVFSLEDAINELRDFDDNVLFPYLEELIRRIEKILIPSPMV